jgi:protein involved in polysaccharide export with SLBB domain
MEHLVSQPQLRVTARAFTLWALFLLLPGPVHGQTRQDDHAQSSFSLRAGDHVQIELYTAAGVQVNVVGGKRTIDQGGEVFLPYIGTLFVADLNQTSLREVLTERYKAFYENPVVDVTVELHVSVTGSVGRSGQYFLSPTATIIDAIAQAGGMSPEIISAANTGIPADQSKVRLVRDGVTQILNLRPDEITNEILHMPIQSGDWIYVPPRTRSRVRDEISFWGNVLGFVTNMIALIFIIGN